MKYLKIIDQSNPSFIRLLKFKFFNQLIRYIIDNDVQHYIISSSPLEGFNNNDYFLFKD